MKRTFIRVVIFLLLFLYVALNQFFLVLPLTILLLIVFILDSGKVKKRNLRGNIYSGQMAVLILLSCISLIWSPNRDDAIFQISILTVLAVNGFLLYYYTNKYNLLSFIVVFTLFVSFINQIAALRIPIFNFLLYNSTERGGADGVVMGWGWGGRFSGMMQNPNSLAIFLLFSIYLSLSNLSLSNFAKKSRFIIYLHVGNILLSFYTLFLTQSRKGLVFAVMLIGLSFFVEFTIKKATIYSFLIVFAIAIAFLVPSIREIVDANFIRANRVADTIQGTDAESSSLHRLYFVVEGWSSFKEKPLLGYGVNSFRHYYDSYSHNNFVELLFGLGLMGFLVYYQIHFKLVQSIRKLKGNSGIYLFTGIILLMDIGYVSYESKINMLVFVTLLIQCQQLQRKNAFAIKNG